MSSDVAVPATTRDALPAKSATRATLWCCYGAGFATLFDAAVVAFTAPAVRSALHLADDDIQWFLAALSLTFGLGLAPAGRLGDAYGRRVLFVSGLTVFLIGAVAAALAHDASLLIGGRLIQGFGAGILSAQVLGVIQDTFQGPERLRALVGYTIAGAFAAVAGPMIAGIALWLLPADFAWRVILLLQTPFTLGAIVLGLWGIPRTPRLHRRIDLDLPGIAFLGALVVLVTIPAIDPGLPGRTLMAIGALCALLVVALVRWERGYARRGKTPLFAPALIGSRGYVTGNIVALLWFGSVLAFGTVTTVYFLQVYSIPALAVAAALIPAAVARMVAARWSERLFARSGPALVTHGLVVQTAVLAGSGVAALCWNGWALFAILSVLQFAAGVSSGVVEPPLRTVTLSFAPRSLHGVAASFLQLTQRLSATIFIALSTGILLAVGGTTSTAALLWATAPCAAASLLATTASRGHAFRTSRHTDNPTTSPAAVSQEA
ncbi:MFS transporter [Nocardia alba]|uniref:MFS transporter n=1 Tax=Nocardia alba TaxID=225051 RepID=UPI0014051055|nr:MFS transporter [Nocardia alba]